MFQNFFKKAVSASLQGPFCAKYDDCRPNLW